MPNASRKEKFVVEYNPDGSNYVASVRFTNDAKMRFVNYAAFKIATDKPLVMKPRDKEICMGEGETAYIDLEIKP